MKLFSIIFTALLASGAIANEISDRMLKMDKASKMGKGGSGSVTKTKKSSKKSAPIEQATVFSLDVVFNEYVKNQNIKSKVISALASSLATNRRMLASKQDIKILNSIFGPGWTLDISRYDCTDAVCLICVLKAALTEAFEEMKESGTSDFFNTLVAELMDLGSLGSLNLLDGDAEDDVVIDEYPPVGNSTRFRLLESRGDYLEWEDFEEEIYF